MLKNIFTSESYQNYWKMLFWIILAMLLFLTLTPRPPKPFNLHNIDKLYHLIAFAGFTFVFNIAFSKMNHWLMLTTSIFLGITIEIAQIYIPNRGFSLADMIADVLGVIIGILIAKLLLAKK